MMKRSNIVVVGLAVMLGLMVGSAEAMEKKRPQIQTAVTAVNFLNKATAASAAKKAQAGGNSFVSAVDDGV